MKLRQRWVIKAAGFAATWMLRLWFGTLSFRYRPLGPYIVPRRPMGRQRFIYALWHENLLLPAYLYGRHHVHVLIGQHSDGELIAEVCRHLGFGTVRGSTTRGGVEALRQMLQLAQDGHLAITPDGPRGPRRRVQPGLIYLAAKTGLPIVPMGLAYDRPWRASSWDRFAMPRPWSAATCVTDHPVVVPPDVTRGDIATYCRRVEESLARLCDAAERLAAGTRAAA